MSDIGILECSETSNATMPLDELIQKLTEARDRTPKGQAAFVEMWAGGEYAHAYLEVTHRKA